jgi:photosystem II stability/assembly factor-like uncharacterized protein
MFPSPSAFLRLFPRPRPRSQRSDPGSRRFFPCLECLEEIVAPSASLSATAWTPIGPAPISVAPQFNQQFNGPVVAGRVNVAAADPSNVNVMYIGTTNGGIWKTTDWLDPSPAWTPLTDNQPSLVINEHCLVVFPGNPQIIYAAASGPGGGVLKSTDGGATWSFLGNSVFDRVGLNAIVVSPTSANTVYVAVADNGAPGGLWRSTDGGQSWANVTSASHSGAVTDVVMDPSNPAVLYAGFTNANSTATNGIYKTTNGGNTWGLLGNGVPVGNGVGGDLIRLAIAPSAPATVYASVFTQPTADNNLPTLYKTTNGGTSWSALTVPPSQDWRPWHALLGVDPANPQVVYANGDGPLYRSPDGGSTWQPIYLEDPVMVHFDDAGALVMVGDRGIYRWTGSGAFQNKQGNLQITLFYNLALDPHNADVVFGIAQDHFQGLKYAGSPVWTYTGAGAELGKILVDPSNSSTVYDYDPLGQFFLRSDDGGTTWQQKITGLDTSGYTDFYTDQAVQNAFAIDPGNPQRLLVGDQRVFETTNRADQWAPISPVLSSGFVIQALAIAPSNGQTVYAATSDGRLFVTHNDGATAWQEQDGGLPRNGILAIQVDPSNPQRVFVVLAGSGVWRTTNGGLSWTDLTHGTLPPAYFAGTPLAVDWRFATPVLYFGTYRGLYRSLDQGATWTRFGQDLPNTWVTDLELVPALDLLAAGTWGRGAFEILVGGPPTHFSVTGPPGATAGSAFPVTVGALDAAGTLSTAYLGTVHFASPNGTALLPANYTFTSSDNGAHPFPVTMDTAGVRTITVTDTANGSVTGSASVLVSAAAATHLGLTLPPTGTAGSAFDVTVTALDSYGNTDPSYRGTVQLGCDDTQATLSGPSAFAASDNGVHLFSGVTLRTAGTRSLTATDTGNASITGSGTVSLSAAAATHLGLMAPATATAGIAFDVTVTALDPYGNPNTGYRGTVQLTSSDPQATLPGPYPYGAADNGSHTFAAGATLVTAGSRSLTASAGGFADVSVPVTVSAAAASYFGMTAPGSSTAGSPLDVTVTAFDPFGNTASNYRGTVQFSCDDTQVTLPPNYTFTTGTGGDNGTHTFPSGVILRTAGIRTVTAADRANPSVKGSVGVTVNPAAATRLAVGAPASALVGVPFSITVTALDPFGNTDPTYAGTVQLGSDDPLATLPGSYTFTTGSGGDNGKHTFPDAVTLRTPGPRSVRVGDTHLIPGSAPVVVSPAPATVTLTASPNSVVFGQPVTLTATVQSVNPSVGTPNGVVVFQDSGSLLGSAALDARGQATLTAVLAPGGHALTAFYGGDAIFATTTSAMVSQAIADQPVAEVTGQVKVTLGRLKRRGGRATQVVTITNVGGQPFEGPLSLVLDGLKRTAKLVNSTGFTSGSQRRRSPFLDVLPGGGRILEPGQMASGALNFSNASGGWIRFTVRVLAGVGVR